MKRVIIKRQDRIDYVLNGVCDFWGITPNELRARVRNPLKRQRKKLATKALIDIADVRQKEIMVAMGCSSESWISQMYDAANDDVCDRAEIRKEWADIKKFLGV